MIRFLRIPLIISLLLLNGRSWSQEKALKLFISDTSMIHASVSFCVKDADSGETITEYNPQESLIPASVMKLITSAVALELLGPGHDFTTILGYTGKINKRTHRLTGNIVIKGGGDPALGSKHFTGHYKDFIGRWISEIKMAGIKTVDGRVITDDSYYDFSPIPAKWLWEDPGNYYGAGVYGLSVFDNTAEIHLQTNADSSSVKITGIVPAEYKYEFENRLIAAGTSDEGNVYAAPYSDHGWLTGTIPASRQDFILNASISDPPLFIAGLLKERLEASGIRVIHDASTVRLSGIKTAEGARTISELKSPPLFEIIEVLNHESVNLYAETLLKELGKAIRNNGSTVSGSDVLKDFLRKNDIPGDGMFIEDGSGLSPGDAINSEALTCFLLYMKNRSNYFTEYFKSLPEAGKEGTLKSYFRDPVFEGRMHAKSGSMTRVRCYAGYLKTESNRNMVFSILVNNYTGPAEKVISGIEEIIREIILYK